MVHKIMLLMSLRVQFCNVNVCCLLYADDLVLWLIMPRSHCCIALRIIGVELANLPFMIKSLLLTILDLKEASITRVFLFNCYSLPMVSQYRYLENVSDEFPDSRE